MVCGEEEDVFDDWSSTSGEDEDTDIPEWSVWCVLCQYVDDEIMKKKEFNYT